MKTTNSGVKQGANRSNSHGYCEDEQRRHGTEDAFSCSCTCEADHEHRSASLGEAANPAAVAIGRTAAPLAQWWAIDLRFAIAAARFELLASVPV